MFKVKLIEDKAYYDFRSKLAILSFVSLLPMSLLQFFHKLSWWYIAPVIAVFIVAIFLMSKYSKGMKALQGKRAVEIDATEIRIKSTKGVAIDTIDLSAVTKIILNETYAMAQESMSDWSSEVTGKPIQNYLIVETKNGTQRLDFEMESHYMVAQLNKLIVEWGARGYPIERVGQTLARA